MIRWGLRDILDEHKITAYRLAGELKGAVSRNTVYALARGEGRRVDLPTLNAVLQTLRRLTKTDIGVGDLLIFEDV